VQLDTRFRAIIKLNCGVEKAQNTRLNRMECRGLKIDAADGVVEVIDEGGIVYHDIAFHQYGEITFFPQQIGITANNSQPKIYWVLPLINFISDSREKISPTEALHKHPLRLYEPWQNHGGLPLEERWKLLQSNEHTLQQIAFQFNDSPCFIERLPSYPELVRSLFETGQRQYSITALMIGSVDDSIDLTDIGELMRRGPVRFEDWLFFATGSRVIIPWVEFRDDDGNLVSRFHFRRTLKGFMSGHTIVDNLGSFLTAAAKSDRFGDILTRAAIYRIALAGETDFFLEDRKAFLFIAADTLTKEVRRTRPKPLESELEAQINNILTNAAAEVMELATGNETQIIAKLELIAGKVTRASASKSPNDALAILELANQLGLKDIEVIDRKKWQQDYVKYRSRIIHEGFFDSEITEPIDEWLKFTLYLRDLLVRIVLKQIEYQGYYRPTTARGLVRHERIDWVTRKTPRSLLGYE
jgi:hypothetical protein